MSQPGDEDDIRQRQLDGLDDMERAAEKRRQEEGK